MREGNESIFLEANERLMPWWRLDSRKGTLHCFSIQFAKGADSLFLPLSHSSFLALNFIILLSHCHFLYCLVMKRTLRRERKIGIPNKWEKWCCETESVDSMGNAKDGSKNKIINQMFAIVDNGWFSFIFSMCVCVSMKKLFYLGIHQNTFSYLERKML